ncbi:N-acetyltransferase [Pseudoalteromonas sp. S3785]|uniref:GNAT family N-acetyltransferase n=1 Tax=Pseudoalteromonas sp. S3785 TaxID=579545 RepID=UPI00110AA81E|nr:GNAT family N-acetyltransferase [Pseudoalteromonas sp. S3785]TMO73151.1 N-acetyltransferase [Pseudoalteromonas sp. S3785]
MHIQISEHIKLAPLVESDAADILKAVNVSRASLGKFLPWVEGVNNIESAKKYILERVNSGLNGSQWFKIYYKDNLSGVFAIKYICPDLNIAELGYWLSCDAQGNGIISQVITKAPQLLTSTHVKFIEFRCLEKNAASIKVALKSGALLVDVIPNFLVADDVWQNLNIYRAAVK